MSEPKLWSYTRLFTRADGHSAFEEVTTELSDHGPIGSLSTAFEVDQLKFRTTPPSYDYDFHNAPARQFIVMLEGGVDIETSTGEHRRFAAGDVLLVEDVEGRGHRSRAVNGELRRSIFITLK